MSKVTKDWGRFALIAMTVQIVMFYFLFWFGYTVGDHTCWWKAPTVMILIVANMVWLVFTCGGIGEFLEHMNKDKNP